MRRVTYYTVILDPELDSLTGENVACLFMEGLRVVYVTENFSNHRYRNRVSTDAMYPKGRLKLSPQQPLHWPPPSCCSHVISVGLTPTYSFKGKTQRKFTDIVSTPLGPQ